MKMAAEESKQTRELLKKELNKLYKSELVDMILNKSIPKGVESEVTKRFLEAVFVGSGRSVIIVDETGNMVDCSVDSVLASADIEIRYLRKLNIQMEKRLSEQEMLIDLLQTEVGGFRKGGLGSLVQDEQKKRQSPYRAESGVPATIAAVAAVGGGADDGEASEGGCESEKSEKKCETEHEHAYSIQKNELARGHSNYDRQQRELPRPSGGSASLSAGRDDRTDVDSDNLSGFRGAVDSGRTRSKLLSVGVGGGPEKSDHGKEGWKTAARKRKQKYAVFGSGTTNSMLKAIPRKRKLFISRIDPDTTVGEIETFLGEEFPEVKCEKITSKHPELYSSFCIEVNDDSAERVLQPEKWPVGTYVNRFFRRKTAEDSQRK